MSPDRGEGGKFTSKVTNSDVLRVLHDQGDPVATARELADILEVTPETVRRHLTELENQGRVGRKDVGARAVVWWPTDAETHDDAPAAPLRQLVGALDEETAAEARERSNAWREAFDDELTSDDS